MNFLRRAGLGLATLLFSLSAHAGELPPLLERALEQGEAANQIRWAFTSTFQNPDAQLTFRFTPEGESGTFSLLAPESLTDASEEVFGRIQQDADADADLTHEQARLVIGDQEVEVVEESETHVVYRVRPGPWDDLDEDEARMMQHMFAELTVDKSTTQVSQIRLYNFERFHAFVVARVDRFDQVMTFAPEPLTGLPLMTSFRQEVEGRAFFTRIHRVRTETYTDYRPMHADGTELACASAACVQQFLAAQ